MVVSTSALRFPYLVSGSVLFFPEEHPLFMKTVFKNKISLDYQIVLV